MIRSRLFSVISKTRMSHIRDCEVIHIDNRIIIDVPLIWENGMIFKDARVEYGRLIINCLKKTEESKDFVSRDK